MRPAKAQKIIPPELLCSRACHSDDSRPDEVPTFSFFGALTVDSCRWRTLIPTFSRLLPVPPSGGTGQKARSLGTYQAKASWTAPRPRESPERSVRPLLPPHHHPVGWESVLREPGLPDLTGPPHPSGHSPPCPPRESPSRPPATSIESIASSVGSLRFGKRTTPCGPVGRSTSTGPTPGWPPEPDCPERTASSSPKASPWRSPTPPGCPTDRW